MAFLSRFFVYGQGHAERPIPAFLALFFLGCAAVWTVLARARRAQEAAGPALSRRIAWIVGVAVLARGFLFFSQPVQEVDFYRYLWDGQTLLQGGNPYAVPPAEVSRADQPPPARKTLERINYPRVRTVYPPGAQALFALGQWLTPWRLTGWRILVLGADLAALGFLLAALLALRRPPEWAVLYGWSPLVLKEFANSLHVDVFAVLFLSAAVWCLVRGRRRAVFALIALAGLVKLGPFLLLAPLAGWAWRRDRAWALKATALAAGVTAAGYLPFLGAGEFLWEGMRVFAGRWQVNSGLFALIRSGWEIFLPGQEAAWASRWTAALGVAAAAGVVTLEWMRDTTDVNRLLAAMLALLAALFLFSPAGNPWYFTWALPFLSVVPVVSLIWLSGIVGLYYLDFYFAYQGIPALFGWVRLAEYGSFFGIAVWEWSRWRKGSPLFCRF